MTHKPTAAQAVDLVIVLDKGVVGGVGQQGGFLRSSARYRAFWQAGQTKFDSKAHPGGGHD